MFLLSEKSAVNIFLSEMKRTVHLESSLKRYLELCKCDGFTPGLLLGQSSPGKDFVVHLARTQLLKNSEDVVKFKEIRDLKVELVIEHIRNVIQILPGGMTILGLFFVGDANLINASALETVKNILNAISKYEVEENDRYFYDKQLTSKYVFHYVDINNITCKRFSCSQDGNRFDVVDFMFSTNSWHRISCYYDFEHLLPVYLESVSNAILHDKFMEILKYVNQSVRESVLLFNGEIRNASEFIKSFSEWSNERDIKNTIENDCNSHISVDLYTPCRPRNPNASRKITKYIAQLKCFGMLCSDVYLHEDATVSEVINAVKEDIIRSLCSRLTMHCNSLLEDLSSSGVDEVKIIHEPPRRLSVLLPYTKVRFTDYLFPGEDNMSLLPAREQLGIRDVEDETKLYEFLEVEADPSEFYNGSGVTNNLTEKLPIKRSNMRFKISLGVLLALLILIFAVLIQKVRFL